MNALDEVRQKYPLITIGPTKNWQKVYTKNIILTCHPATTTNK